MRGLSLKISLSLVFLYSSLFSCMKAPSITADDFTTMTKHLFNNQRYRECIDLELQYPNVPMNESTLTIRAWCFVNMYKTDSSFYEFYKSYLLNDKNSQTLLGLSQFDSSIKSRIKYSLEYINLIDDSLNIAGAYQRIGHNYKLEKDFDKSIINYDSSIAYLGIEINDIEKSYLLYKKALAQYLSNDNPAALLTIEKYIVMHPTREDAKELKESILTELN